jgi:hypothetical protein
MLALSFAFSSLALGPDLSGAGCARGMQCTAQGWIQMYQCHPGIRCWDAPGEGYVGTPDTNKADAHGRIVLVDEENGSVVGESAGL